MIITFLNKFEKGSFVTDKEDGLEMEILETKAFKSIMGWRRSWVMVQARDNEVPSY